MIIQIALGLLPIASGFMLLGFLMARVAKKRGNNPWLWAVLTVVVITVASWQHLPRWVGYLYVLEMSAVRAIAREFKMTNPEPPNPNVPTQFNLSADKYNYTFSLPAVYEAKQPLDGLVRFNCKYPAMAASPGMQIGNGNLSIDFATERSSINRPQSFLKTVDVHNAHDDKFYERFAGKQGKYDLYQNVSNVTGEIVTKFMFTSKDGELVLVEPRGVNYRVWRNVGPGIGITYSVFNDIGNDFIKIDEVVTDFIKSHLVSKPTQGKEAR